MKYSHTNTLPWIRGLSAEFARLAKQGQEGQGHGQEKHGGQEGRKEGEREGLTFVGEAVELGELEGGGQAVFQDV